MGSISKRRREHFEVTNEDRISNLPTSLIGHILSFLPTKKAVATSVLSTKWKYLWTSITILDFDDGLVHVSTTPRKDLQKFRLNCTGIYDVSHVNVWVSTALSRNPRELNLSNIGCLPRELYACRSLVVLKLCGTPYRLLDLSIPTLICLRSLKILVIESVVFLDDDSIYRLFSSCHVLEDLSVELCDWRNISVFNISAPNLKSLTIKCRTWTNVSGKYKIVLNTPNLQDIKYEDYVAAGYSGNKLNGIVKADISFVKTFPVRDGYKENLAIAEFVERISKAQWLHLSNYSIEVSLLNSVYLFLMFFFFF
ncbi:F-box/LRR-repeat protein At3g59200-like [Cornus florida]|uniref:F-box/LRR-repeat protein At3g59200-like n=1 Tax=Cornus florida TaxID=4283 RepID=UPI0028988A5F|nr:F-box/LRR-repeat protein At3g59200-like [Cornus florida]